MTVVILASGGVTRGDQKASLTNIQGYLHPYIPTLIPPITAPPSLTLFVPTGLISFSEATRFTATKHAESQTWCAANGRPQPQHLLYPRTKGFVTTVQHLRRAPHVRTVYDVAIAYQRGGRWHAAPDMWETLSLPRLSAPDGHACRFHVHVRRFLVEDLPTDDEGLAKWLERRWVEKGEWLEAKRVEWAAKGRRNDI